MEKVQVKDKTEAGFAPQLKKGAERLSGYTGCGSSSGFKGSRLPLARRHAVTSS